METKRWNELVEIRKEDGRIHTHSWTETEYTKTVVCNLFANECECLK